MNQKIDIEYIAKLAGVSRSTVSRVLTNSNNVKKETKEKVQAIMQQYNYTPSVMARGLATGKLNIVALVISDVRNPFYAELVWVINKSLREKGYLMTLYNSSYGIGESDDYLTGLLSYGFAGIIIADARNEENFGHLLNQATCPVVLVNRDLGLSTNFDTIMIDNRKGGYIATKHLLELGHTKIAMLRGPKFSTSSSARYEGYLYALKEYGIEKDKRYINIGDFTMESGEQFAYELLVNMPPEDRPTAIFAGGDNMAYGILNLCKTHNINVPHDISIVGFDDIPMSKTNLIDLTTVRQPYLQIGQLVATKIIERIQGDASELEKIMLMPKLHIRGTTSKPSLTL